MNYNHHTKRASLPKASDITVTKHHKIIAVTNQTDDRQKEELLANPKFESQMPF